MHREHCDARVSGARASAPFRTGVQLNENVTVLFARVKFLTDRLASFYCSSIASIDVWQVIVADDFAKCCFGSSIMLIFSGHVNVLNVDTTYM